MKGLTVWITDNTTLTLGYGWYQLLLHTGHELSWLLTGLGGA